MPEGANDQQQQDQQTTAGTQQAADQQATQQGADDQQSGNGSSASQQNGQSQSPFAVVENADVRDWLTRSESVKDINSLAQKAYEQERIMGSMVRVPGDDASPEDRAAFLEKAGLAPPKDPDGYEFTVPKDLPENVPYDEDAAKEFKQKAHELGLTASQAAGLHDWFAGAQSERVSRTFEQQTENIEAQVRATNETLTKLWGPLDGKTAKANAEFADRALAAVGDEKVIAELQEVGLLGPNKEVTRPHFAVLMASLGAAMYTEDDVLKGEEAAVGNPFDKNGPNYNLTKAMALYKQNPDHAKQLMRAAGMKPEDFGVPA